MRKLLLVAVLVMLFGWNSGASALPANNSITAGLVAAYEFTGNADDVSGNGNDGVVNGATLTADRFGNVGSAYSFDGVDDVISMPSPISGHAEFSSSLWFQLGADSSPYETALQVGIGAVQYDTATETLILDIYPDRNGGASNGSSVSTRYLYSPSISGLQASWLHLAFIVHADDTGEVFVNGSSVSGGPRFTDGGVTGNYDQSRIGATYDSRTSGTHHHFHGSIDDVYLYNRALSPTEVSTLYSAIPEPSTALLLGLGLVGLAAGKRV
jgi:hypothetical protein